MTKYYRVKQDTFLWKAGAILIDQNEGAYKAVEDIWDSVDSVGNEYISGRIIEDEGNAAWFERVYPDTISGKLYKTKDQLIEMYNNTFK
jgi:hypothetical protein